MSIWGIGIDICEIQRFDKLLERPHARFIKRVLHPNEIQQFLNEKLPARFLAKRFAAKEALVKALGTGFTEKIVMPDIEITHTSAGQPVLQLHGSSQCKLDEISTGFTPKLHLSISDEKHYAVAQVIVELNAKLK